MASTAGLRAWIAVGHPRYRPLLAQLLALGLLLAGLAYVENSLLQGFVRSLADDPGPDEGLLASLLSPFAHLVGFAVAFLGAIFVVGLFRASMFARSRYLGNELSMRSRDDLEGQVLYHLLHRDDAFYTRHSPGEILNRLEGDIYRIIQRRETLVDVVSSALLVASNLIFFGMNDWRLAATVVVICVVGTLVTQRANRPVQSADSRFWNQHDRVKTRFEDYLKGYVEIQVGSLFEPILAKLRRPQAERLNAFRSWARADARVELSRGGWPVLAFLLSVLVVLSFFRPDAGHATGALAAERLSLIPVLVFALPGVFGHVTYLASLGLSFGLASNSIDRILEYESDAAIAHERDRADAPNDGGAPGAARPRTPVPASTIHVDAATYRYAASDGTRQGGVEGVTTSFEPGTWSSIIGGAGSGKSTLINLMLGRTRPQEGRVLLGVTDLASAPTDALVNVAAYMPQKVVLLDESIRSNLYLHWSDADDVAVPPEDLDVLDRLGLGAICRLKALDLLPGHDVSLDDATVRRLRQEARQAIAPLGLRLFPLEEGHVDPGSPLVDALLAGKADEAKTVPLLAPTAGRRFLNELIRDGLGDALIPRGRLVLEQSRHLLEVDDYQDFLELAPTKTSRDAWEIRRAGLQVVSKSALSTGDRITLAAVALTARPAEWGASHEEARAWVQSLRASFPSAVEALRSRLRAAWQPYDVTRVHPYLSWRDNLLFATIAASNQRQLRRLDEALLDMMQRPEWNPFFVSQGLAFEVGRGGSRLSGGQGQLIALARALLPRTPLVILDEPTSALDPASRDRVADFLHEWRDERVVVTISHDPHLVRRSDEIHVMQGGRLVDRGSYDALSASSDPFRSVFRLEGA